MPSLNILFLAAHLPVLGVHGGGTRMYHNLKALASKHSVSLISFIESELEQDSLASLAQLGICVRTILRKPVSPRHLLVPKPREHDEYASQAMGLAVRQALAGQRFQVVQAEYSQMGQHVPVVPAVYRILTEHEVAFANARADLSFPAPWYIKLKRWYEWMVQLNYEVQACRRFHRVVCMTDEDRETLGQFVPSGNLRTIPIGVDCDYFCPGENLPESSAAPSVLFVGNYRHLPNQNAVYCFAEDILPRVRQIIPQTEFNVVGGNIQLLDARRLSGCGPVNLIGPVEDIRPCYWNADVFVAPIWSGNGMRVKVLEALSMAKAVVATPLALQGLRPGPVEICRTADSPERFAGETVRLLQDAQARRRIGANARSRMLAEYDWRLIGRQLLELVENRDA
jgi:glycosyltransferase involved in cell wall biosynthesis